MEIDLSEQKITKEQALSLLSRFMKSDSKNEHFKGILDIILGTVLQERDGEIESAWENRKRDDE